MGQCASRSRRRIHSRDFGGGDDDGESVHSRCYTMVKEHKSRFYIIRRCIMMLICWHKYDHHHKY
ncbi:unnamed protein product [Trifolium pratense]|uniref:Uncharacterized protein n=1 Tax=Trifolium pratense TaxID=57577 RepID=A0ACB0JNK0_TRIPR|nr:unnamed protein product [Trifolium pratense]